MANRDGLPTADECVAIITAALPKGDMRAVEAALRIDSPCVLQIYSYASGSPSPHDGQYVVEYDPTRRGVNASGKATIAHLVLTHDLAQARRFTDPGAAHACWTAESGRPGPASRPLTAYTVVIERVPA